MSLNLKHSLVFDVCAHIRCIFILHHYYIDFTPLKSIIIEVMHHASQASEEISHLG